MTARRLISIPQAKPAPCRSARVILCAFLLLVLARAEAVLFYWTGDPTYHTDAPTGPLTNSGWQYQGAWEGFDGTVISSNCFITANHVGGSVGKPFVFQGVEYPTIASYPDAESDLRIWRVAGQFPTYAPLYTKGNEPGKTAVVIGRGRQRGDEVRVNGKLKGWQWGTPDGAQRWGQNRINSLVYGGPGVGALLRATFDAGANRNEADLSGGDSGGAVFIKDGKFYKLAGINHGVDGPFNTTNSDTGFEAAIFDQRGLYVTNYGSGWSLVPSQGGRVPGSFYATRISSRISWITNVLATPTP